MEFEQLNFPLSRYWYADEFRFYYAYGNTPAQDFLQNCRDTKNPAILALGCGDIRSCFYTLWKNFDVCGVPRFDGVDFVLNDISAAVLARNIIFLALCLQVPSTEKDYKKWLSCVWAIWYCHELYPEHQKVLEDCLQMLCKHSDSWTSSDNPLYPMVKFTSPSTLAEVVKVWKMWLRRDINVASVKEMQVSRNAELTKRGLFSSIIDELASGFVKSSTEISGSHFQISDSIVKTQKAEVFSYWETGSVFAERVLGMGLSKSTSVNPTFYERCDGRYTLHYGSLPFRCFFHSVPFLCEPSTSMTVSVESFSSLPFLANSVQQFSLWLQAFHKVVNSHKLSFAFDCSHALKFCFELSNTSVMTDLRNEFDLIYTSNLTDHVSLPNLVLSTIPLLKPSGTLFTATCFNHHFKTEQQFLEASFGFDVKLFPVLLGIRCINNEGVYASSVAVQPSPFHIPATNVFHEAILIWEKMRDVLPLIIPSSLPLTAVLSNALGSATEACAYSVLNNSEPPSVMCHRSLETSILMFQTFMANCCASYNFQFWRPLCDSLKQMIKPFLSCMQVQLLLHGVHMHLTVTDEKCPLCQNKELSTLVGLFCVSFQSTAGPSSPKFMAIVHKEGHDDANHLCELARKNDSADIHVLDCFYPSSFDGEVKLYFYAPLQLAAKEEYRLTIVSAVIAANGNTYSNVTETLMLKKLNVPFRCFRFSQPLPHPSVSSASLGSIISHLSNGDSSEVEISTTSTVSANKLEPKLISANIVKLLYDHQACFIKYPYPVDFKNSSIKVSKKNRKIFFKCPRTCHKFEEELPLFIASPDKELALLPLSLSEDTLRYLCGQQFSPEDCRILDSCNGEPSLMPSLVNVKQAFSSLFQLQNCNHYYLNIGGESIHGLISINERLYDYENQTAVIDLLFCFLEESFVDDIVPAWESLKPREILSIYVTNDAEYDFFKRVFTFFAHRTHSTCTSSSSLLAKIGIEHYFTRAVIYPLFCSKSTFVQAICDQEPQQQKVKEKCDNCKKHSDDTRKCSKCKKVQYCSKGCQAAHWKVHKTQCKQSKVVVKNTDTKTTLFRPFSLTRYCYTGDFRFYYGYGNTPAEDFLENCHEVKEPEILLLGCGDIRSCFYTFWKNFDFSISKAPKRFDGVHFTLNDCSTAVLARNMIFLYLCLELPQSSAEKKKWLSAMWAIWYCHELYPHHQQVLNESLKLLIKYSGSVEQWNKAENPLHCLVGFTSPTVLAEISQLWKLWFEQNIPSVSVDQMHSARKMELGHHGIYNDLDTYILSYCHDATYISGDSSDRIKTRPSEVLSYIHSGSCYAETVMSRQPLEQQPTVVNLTLYEKPDGVYNLHYGSMPFSCYHHTLEFSPSLMKEAGLARPLISSMLVPAESFESHPFLANSVQQFSMWIQSASRALKDRSYRISFKFNNFHAVSFCQELQYHGSDQNNSKFDLINASNLMDHLGPPGIMLSSIPLLKPKGLLFASTLLYRNFSPTIEDFLHMCFGFDFKLLPAVLGIRCINHEGVDYSSPVIVEPKLPRIVAKRYERMLICERVTAQPFVFTQLPPLRSGNVTDALLDFIRVSVYSLIRSSKGLEILNHYCTEVAILVLQRFLSLVDGAVYNDYHFWNPLSTEVVRMMKPFLHSLQTQSLLHNIHIHLTVTEDSCSICQGKLIEESIGLFCVEVSLPLQAASPHFLVLAHKIESSDAQYLCDQALTGGEVQIIDTINGTVENQKLKLKFHAPLEFIDKDYKITVASTTMVNHAMNVIFTIISSSNIKDFKIPFEHFNFLHAFCYHHGLGAKQENSLGVISSHSCSGDQTEIKINLSSSSLELIVSNHLTTKKIAPDMVKISCVSLACCLKFIYPVDYDKVKVELSKKNKTITIYCPRKVQFFCDEKPMFIVNPDHQLSLPPTKISDKIMICHSGMQMKAQEHELATAASDYQTLKSPLLNVKVFLTNFFQRKGNYFVLWLNRSMIPSGVFIVNNVMYDYQHRTPVVDLAFCFINQTNQVSVDRLLFNIQDVCDIQVNDAGFELIQETLYYFAKRTNGTCHTAGRNSRLNILVQMKIDSLFTRAVVYLLYCDPDEKGANLAKSLGIAKMLEVPQPAVNSDITDKCKYCGKYKPVTNKCPRCKKVNYCCESCQEKDWTQHNRNCSISDEPPSKFDSSAPRAMPKCAFCEASSEKLLTCGRCGMVKYCGKECQKKHWKEHKKLCVIKK